MNRTYSFQNAPVAQQPRSARASPCRAGLDCLPLPRSARRRTEGQAERHVQAWPLHERGPERAATSSRASSTAAQSAFGSACPEIASGCAGFVERTFAPTVRKLAGQRLAAVGELRKSSTTRASSTPRSPSARPRRPQSTRRSPVAAGVLQTRATRPPNTSAQRRTSSKGWAAPAATSR
jgi:hypothetical protein